MSVITNMPIPGGSGGSGGGISEDKLNESLQTNLTDVAKKSDITSAVSGLAKASDVTSAVSGLAKASDVTSAVAGLAKPSDVASAVANLADKVTLDEVHNAVTTLSESAASGNSDVYTWINDYKTYGTNSYVYRLKDIWEELTKNRIAVNDNAVMSDAFQYWHDINDIGTLLNNMEQYDYSSVVSGISGNFGFNALCLEQAKRNVFANFAYNNQAAAYYLYDNISACKTAFNHYPQANSTEQFVDLIALYKAETGKNDMFISSDYSTTILDEPGIYYISKIGINHPFSSSYNCGVTITVNGKTLSYTTSSYLGNTESKKDIGTISFGKISAKFISGGDEGGIGVARVYYYKLGVTE